MIGKYDFTRKYHLPRGAAQLAARHVFVCQNGFHLVIIITWLSICLGVSMVCSITMPSTRGT